MLTLVYLRTFDSYNSNKNTWCTYALSKRLQLRFKKKNTKHPTSGLMKKENDEDLPSVLH